MSNARSYVTTARRIEADRMLYARLHVADEDLGQATYFANHLLKKGWHFHPWERRWSTYMQQSAYTTAAVIAYARPFTESRGWPKFPKRLIRYDEDQKELHRKVLSLRDELYVHSHVPRWNIRPFKINGYASAIESMPSMRLDTSEATRLLEMIGIVRSEIHDRLQELIGVVADET